MIRARVTTRYAGAHGDVEDVSVEAAVLAWVGVAAGSAAGSLTAATLHAR
jgi:hypothetical protein